MTHRRYELTFVLPPALAEEEIQAKQHTIQEWISDQAGEVLKVNHWGRRRLAYPVQTYKEGYYILLEFQHKSSAIKDIDRRLRLDTAVLRHLIVQADQ